MLPKLIHNINVLNTDIFAVKTLKLKHKTSWQHPQNLQLAPTKILHHEHESLMTTKKIKAVTENARF